MKKYLFILVLVVMITFLISNISYAIFVIKLKNGRALSAENYQIEGNKIILYLKQGTIKISKDEISSIIEVKGRLEEEDESMKEETIEERKETPKEPEKKESKKDLGMEKKDIDFFIKKKSEIKERLEEAKGSYFNAKEKNEKKTAREKMISISKELFSLLFAGAPIYFWIA